MNSKNRLSSLYVFRFFSACCLLITACNHRAYTSGVGLESAEPTSEPRPPTFLPEGHYVPAKMPMTLVHPRPDDETQPWARHKRAYPGLEYRIPVVVQGGAYPFHYELVQGPAGMRMASGYNDEDYGELIWMPQAEGGPYPVEIKITDQDRNGLSATFSVTVAKEGFVFVNPKAAESGDGRLEAPYQRLTQARGHAGAAIYLREGVSHTADQFTGGRGWTVQGSQTPMALLGYPGEQAVLDFSNSRISVAGGAQNGGDFFVGQITTRGTPANGGPADAAVVFWIWGGSGHRFTSFRNTFTDALRNPAYRDIQAVFHVSAKAWESNRYDEYMSFVGNRFSGNFTMQMIGPLYGIRYVVIEGNRWDVRETPDFNNGGYPLIHIKQETTKVSIRRNTAVLNSYNDRMFLYLASKRRYTVPDEVEFSYNLTYAPNWAQTKRGGPNPIKLQQSTGGGEVVDDRAWVYRNTIFGAIGAGPGRPIVNTIERNVVVYQTAPSMMSTDKRTVIWQDNLELRTQAEADEALDNDFRLKGAFREKAGTVGHEIVQE